MGYDKKNAVYTSYKFWFAISTYLEDDYKKGPTYKISLANCKLGLLKKVITSRYVETTNRYVQIVYM